MYRRYYPHQMNQHTACSLSLLECLVSGSYCGPLLWGVGIGMLDTCSQGEKKKIKRELLMYQKNIK